MFPAGFLRKSGADWKKSPPLPNDSLPRARLEAFVERFVDPCWLVLVTVAVPGWANGDDSLSRGADAVEDQTRDLLALVDDDFSDAPDYRGMKKQISRLHQSATEIEEEIAKGDFTRAGRLADRFDFDFPAVTSWIYRQPVSTVPSRTVGKGIDLAHGITKDLREVRTLLSAAQAVVKVSHHTVHRPAWNEDDVIIEEENDDWGDVDFVDSNPAFLPGGMRTNPLLADDGTLIGSPFPKRGYLERINNPHRLPTAYGGDWFDPYRPSRRWWPYGGFGYGRFGYGYGWSIYNQFGPPYLGFFYSGNYLFSY